MSDPGAISAAIRKFPCTACGADVVWKPGAAALVCPYCGTRQEVEPAGEPVRERSLAEGLARPRDTGWGIERKSVRCTRCGATETLDPAVAATSCAFCGTPTVVEAPANPDLVRPEGLLPFAIDFHAAVARFRDWIGRLWFRPGDLKEKSSVATLRGVYVPFWTFDADTRSHWSADAGFNYQVQVQVTRGGRSVTETQTRTRWEHRSGTLDKRFDDLPVPASRGLDPTATHGIEPFPTDRLVPYDPRYLSGFLAEEYGVDLPEAERAARERMTEEIRAACGAAVPGDTYRNLQVETSWSELAYKGALLPIWIAAYQYGGKTYRFLVNGVTGQVDGDAPWSWAKIAAAVAAAVLLILLLSRLG